MTGPTQWHFLTAEYPPEPGGVADYTRLLATALATRGEVVHVWAPSTERDDPEDQGVLVHRLSGFGPRGLRELDEGLRALPGPRRLFVQYVPTALRAPGHERPADPLAAAGVPRRSGSSSTRWHSGGNCGGSRTTT